MWEIRVSTNIKQMEGVDVYIYVQTENLMDSKTEKTLKMQRGNKIIEIAAPQAYTRHQSFSSQIPISLQQLPQLSNFNTPYPDQSWFKKTWSKMTLTSVY